SDHPSLVTDGHHLYLSWHTRNEGFRLIRLTNHGEAALLPFDQETLQSIESRLRGKPFLLAIWSIDCAPCRIELQNLAQKRQSSPSFELILVSADQLQDSKEVQAVLKQYGLDTLDSWIFAHSFKEKIRFAIDKDWAGELPRNYLYDASGHRKAVSGRLTEALLKNL
ncbi:MAG: TlpA family protein disulfide reductase, partial [Gammaproteobacteria bacterium]|nr:TlpA family protein disulfide reductase [Gammaproteobacteria bacterium]